MTMAALHFIAPWRRVIPFPWSLIGLVPLVAGVVLELVADAGLKKHGTTVMEARFGDAWRRYKARVRRWI